MLATVSCHIDGLMKDCGMGVAYVADAAMPCVAVGTLEGMKWAVGRASGAVPDMSCDTVDAEEL